MKLIDAEKLVGKEGLFGQRGCPGNCQHCGLWTNEGCRVIIEAPTVDPVKHAQWIDIYGGKYANPRYACSSCGGKALWDNVQDELLSWHEVQVFSDFCPHCGARMDGGKDGQP